MSVRTLLLSNLLMLLTTYGAIAQTTQPRSADEQWNDQVRSAEAEAASLPQVKADSITKVVKFGMKDGMMTATTEVAPVSGEVKVITSDLPGIIRLKRFESASDSAAKNSASNFQYLQEDFSQKEVGQVNTMVSAVAGRFLLSRDSENGQALNSIQLIQDPPPQAGEPPHNELPVRLIVHGSGENGEMKINVAANSFLELRLDHAWEVDTFIRPIIRGFHQEREVFSIPSELAWQVLAGDFRVDQALVTQVKTLVSRLDIDDYRQRKAAMEDLKKLGQPAVLVLMRLNRNEISVQQSAEIDSFLADTAPLANDASKSLLTNRSFLFDVLYSDEAPLRTAAIKKLNDLGMKVDLDPALDPDQRASAVEALRQQFLPPTTMPVLDK